MRRLLFAAVVLATLCGAVVADAAEIGASIDSGRAATNVPLQPGAPLVDQQHSLFEGTYCTLNFVFEDMPMPPTPQRPNPPPPKTYIGTSANCTTHVGQRAMSPQIGLFGTVVFRDYSYPHFAMIAIDSDKLRYVSTVMRGYGRSPTGYTTSDETNAGDPLVTHGWPAGGTGPSGVTRYGVLAGDTPEGYTSTVQPTMLDRGSPVMRVLDGKALGISNELYWPVAQRTVEGLLDLVGNAGFDVTLK